MGTFASFALDTGSRAPQCLWEVALYDSLPLLIYAQDNSRHRRHRYEETESEEGRKRSSSGTIRQTCPGHVARVGVRGDTAAPLAKGFIYVLRPSILIKSVWVLHHHGGGRVESLVKKC